MSKDQFVRRACADLGITYKPKKHRRTSFQHNCGSVRASYGEQRQIVQSYVQRAGGVL